MALAKTSSCVYYCSDRFHGVRKVEIKIAVNQGCSLKKKWGTPGIQWSGIRQILFEFFPRFVLCLKNVICIKCNELLQYIENHRKFVIFSATETILK